MALIELETFIAAPPERCFDLALSVELHLDSTVATRERAIAGKTSGVLALGLMIDRFQFAVLPLLDSLVLTRHFRNFLTARNALIKRTAEGRTSRYDVGDSRA